MGNKWLSMISRYHFFNPDGDISKLNLLILMMYVIDILSPQAKQIMDLSLNMLKGYDYGSLSYFIIVKNKLVNKIEKKLGRNIV